MGEAAKICLKAIGMQDTHLLSKDPEDSLFKYRLDQFSNFMKIHKSRVVTKPATSTSWPFGEVIKVEYNPNQMEDLLSDMWIKITLPKLDNTTNYPDQVSSHIIKGITMFVDGIKVEELTDDWNFMYNELYLNDTQHEANQLLTNNGFEYTYFGSQGGTLGYLKRDILIPLHFFFSRKYDSDDNRPCFPLCSIYRQKITFEITFHKQSFFTDFSSAIALPEFTIITEEIKLEPEERLYLKSSQHTFQTDIVYKHSQESSEIDKRKFKMNFSTNKPIKVFHWFYRKTQFENENDTTKYKLRFNFTSSNTPFIRTDGSANEIVDKIDIFLNGESVQYVSGTRNHRYFKYYTPYECGLNTPTTHIYTYNLSLSPSKYQNSGIIDFSKITSDKSFIETQLHNTLSLSETYQMHVYYVAYSSFNFRDGFMNISN